MLEYDVARIFKRIEEILIDSMIRNFKRHKAEEAKEGFKWEQWQSLQLKELERYRKQNKDRFKSEFEEINNKVADAIMKEYSGAQKKERRGLMGFLQGKAEVVKNFFGINDKKVDALIDATTHDLERGEYAILRQANDQYRKIIFDAQMYAATGGTYEQAVDMATRDFLRAGIQSITYKNGARHTMQDYASMAIRTGLKRAYLMGEGNVRKELGIHTVRVNSRYDEPCPLCIEWIDKVLVDDVYSGGTKEEAEELNVPLLSQAMTLGFLHPNCKDMVSTYIEGVSVPAKKWEKEELEKIANQYNVEQQWRHAKNMAAKYRRMSEYSLDESNKAKYADKAEEWLIEASNIKPSALDAYDSKYEAVEAIRNLLDEMDDIERENWEEAIGGGGLVFDIRKNSNTAGYFHPLNKTVHIRRDSPPRVSFHELGHRKDQMTSLEVEYEGETRYTSSSGIIDMTCDPDKIYGEIVDYFGYKTNKSGKIIGIHNAGKGNIDRLVNIEKLEEWKDKKQYEEKWSFGDLSDVIDCIAGITENAVGEDRKFSVHDTGYWRRRSFWKTETDGENGILEDENGKFIGAGTIRNKNGTLSIGLIERGTGSLATNEAFAHYCSWRAERRNEIIELLAEISPTYVEELEYAYEQTFLQ